ncbi:MAG: family 43 glycosylhydrolase, partial [Lacunisphaera sp.]
TPTFANVTVHDPSVVRDGATYYVFGSHLASASTTDLMHWTQLTTDWNATTNPTNSLIRNGSPQTEFATALSYTTPPDFWAPDVIKLGDGHYYFYYSVCNGTSRAALGLATANAITGPYANVGILLESGMTGLSPDGTTYNNAVHPNVVDPSVFFDHAGKLWMVYGSYSGGIFILSLDPPTGQPFAGQAYGKKLIGGNNSTIEGPYIIYSPESAYYYLFFTFGGLDSTGGYNIRVGRSHNPDGPYLDAAGNDLTNVKGAPNTVFDNASIAPYGVKLMGNYQFLHADGDPQSTSIGYVSPGGASVNYDSTTGKYLMVFHARFVGRGEQHEVRVHQFFLNADGWPVVAPQRYAQETMATTEAAQIPGTYKLINHGKDITATVKASTLITLKADQSVSGSTSGTWQLSGDHFASLTLAGTSYHGVFVRLWDDDNQIWTMTFTAISTDGVAVWGTKSATAAATGPSPAITTSPSTQTASSGHSVSFQVTASGGTSYQWQESTNAGNSWTTLSDNTTYAGTTTSTLTISNAGSAMDGNRYRALVTNTAGTTNSSAATLSVVTPVFPSPVDVAINSAGSLLVSDGSKNTVQLVNSSGSASLLAGMAGLQGSADGAGSAAAFRQPQGVAIDSSGNLYVADTANSLIRKIAADGTVSTVAGSTSHQAYQDGPGPNAWFNLPAGIAIDLTGTLYVADTGNSVIRKITTAGVVSTLAGTAGTRGSADGAGAAAQFNQPGAIAVDAGGTVFVADSLNHTIRKISSTGTVTTLAGLAGVTGISDGTGSAALFNDPLGVTIDSAGNAYVSDSGNSTIRRISAAGVVTTFAGLPGVSGLKDGTGTEAWFNRPMGLRFDSAGNLYVADNGNAAIRRITAGGTVSTWIVAQGTSTPTAPITPTTPPTPTTPTAPSTPASSGGGGGGAPSSWFFGSLILLGTARWRARRHRTDLRDKSTFA